MFSFIEKGITDLYHGEKGSLSCFIVTYALVDYNSHVLKLMVDSYSHGCDFRGAQNLNCI